MSQLVITTKHKIIGHAKCPSTWLLLFLGLFLALPEFGFSAPPSLEYELEGLQAASDKLRAFLFSRPIRVTVFCFAFVIGFIMTIVSQSLKPLFVPMAIGAVYYFVPFIIDTYDRLWGQ